MTTRRSRKPRPGTLRIREATGAPVATYEFTENEVDRYDDLCGAFKVDPANVEVYKPSDSSRIEPEGAWAMITRKLPPLEGYLDREFRVGRILWIDRMRDADANGFSKGGVYKVLCRSPWGEVCLWPYEYSTVEPAAILEMWTAGEIVFHPTNIDGARFTEIAFYARCRGIGLGEAAVMALGSLTGPVGWFEPRGDLAEECEAMEQHVHRPWPALDTIAKSD
jgi:hypothetical protein